MSKITLHNFTRGGQTFFHNLRMMNQVLNRVVVFSFAAMFIIIGSYVTYKSEPYQLRLLTHFSSAKLAIMVGLNIEHNIKWRDGKTYTLSSQKVVHSAAVKNRLIPLAGITYDAIKISLLAYLVLLIGIVYWFKARGRRHIQEKHIQGDRLGTTKEVKRLLKRHHIKTDLILGGMPLMCAAETTHHMFVGSTGSGKSTAIKSLLRQIRARGDRAIIYDKSCNFTEELYLPGKDIILNPLDERGASWHLWNECRDSADFDSIASAQIPMPPGTADPFWINAARTIFSAVAFEMKNDKQRNIIKLLQNLLTADLDKMQKLLQGTEAATLVSDKIEKTAVSIKSVLATYLKSLKYVKDAENPFSIRDWVGEDKNNNWLFITSLGDRHETLKPLITMWLDIAVNSILSLESSPTRRIWLILDELPSLHRLPYLTTSLSEARKFGGCFVLGLQSYAQLCDIYGAYGAEEISALLNTRYLFRQPDAKSAKWASENLGEAIVEEIREGISYGANSIRDGVSLQKVEVKKPVVHYSDILTMENLCCYLRMPGNYPITKLHFQHQPIITTHPGFIQRSLDETQLKGIDNLIERYARPSSDGQAFSAKENLEVHPHAQVGDMVYGI